MKRRIKYHLKNNLWMVINVVVIIFFMIEILMFVFTLNQGGNLVVRPVISKSKSTTIPMLTITKQPDDRSAKALTDFVVPPIQDGMAPVITNIPTNQKIVFLTIDDGAFKDQSVIDIIKKNNIKASLFLSKAFIASNPDFFKQIVSLGSLIEDHTISHDTNMVTDEDYYQQRNEICSMADYELDHYGRRPIFYRPPGGAYSSTMRRAAADCGMEAVVTWIAKVNGGSMQYQIGNKLRPGDIVLMHFRPEFKQDMQAFINAQNAAGLHTELLEDLVP